VLIAAERGAMSGSEAELQSFVSEQLPRSPARVLEVGCGAGELTKAIGRLDHRVIGIDPVAPAGPLFRRTSLEEFADPGPFDAVVASRSLHHVTDLAGALDKVASLLRAEGRLIVNEHAFDRLDERTARWYLEKRVLVAADAPRSLQQCRAEWERDHADLHGYAAMRRELDRRFAELFFAWTPYLYGELEGVVDVSEERDLIHAGEIQATGFRYVGELLG
jgi:SAM-dependent methyltransferase